MIMNATAASALTQVLVFVSYYLYESLDLEKKFTIK